MSDNNPFGAEAIMRALDEARARIESERRTKFAPFGVPQDCLWPGSRVFHEHSSLGPAWKPALTVKEVEQHTWNLDYKRYPGAPRIALPHPPAVAAPLESTIRQRRSASQFAAAPIELSNVAKLLELGAGVTRSERLPRRAAPSGGALYPVETYALAFGVDGLDVGIYHYLPLEHALEQVRLVPGVEVTQRFLPPGLVEAQPKLILAMSAVFERTQLKYLERGYRFALLEAGHIAQNLLLAATALGLGAVPVGGFWDDPFNELLGFDGVKEAVLYAVLVGQPPSEAG